MAEAGLLDPAEEAEGMVGLPCPLEDGQDQVLVEGSGRAERTDRVLQTRGPRSLRHHITDRFVQGRRSRRSPPPPLLRHVVFFLWSQILRFGEMLVGRRVSRAAEAPAEEEARIVPEREQAPAGDGDGSRHCGSAF